MNYALPEFIKKQKLLVVDDNPASLYATSRILRSAGFDVLEAATGTDALAFATEEIALIVLDINLPDIDGLEVCRQLRARTYAAYLPIVHLSATFVTTADMSQGLTAGADSYLTHPADPALLVATVRTLLFARHSDAIRRASDSRFRAVFDLASSGIAIMDANFRYLDVNPAFCALAGRSRPELIGQTLMSIVTAEGQGISAAIGQAVASAGHWEGMLPVLRTNGEIAAVEWRIATDVHGSRIAIATDVTERRRAEAERDNLLAGERAARGEAERLNRVKDEFLATLSHELRNPLNAIVGWVSVLQRTPSVTAEVKRGLDVIERNSRLQAHLIADLLDYAGMRFGKMHLDRKAIDPVIAIQAALGVVAPLAQAKNIRLTTQWAADRQLIMGDDARLQQVIWNLVSNAIKFTPTGGQVSVLTRAVNGNYEISVSDTGRGISAGFLPYIFDRFAQQESGSSKTVSGLGIGLTIVKHLVEAHGGTISALSEGEGLGSEFLVRLPITREPARAQTASAAGALSGMKILVVEDDADTRAFIVRILESAGATVIEASGGDEALALLRIDTPHLLLSDIGMAKLDGYQLIRDIRASGYAAGRLPAIALTAFSRQQDRADALSAGFQAHLSKPIESDQLINAIADFRPSRSEPLLS